MTTKSKPLRREKNHAPTLERARKRIAAVTSATSQQLWSENGMLAEGWLGALHVEGLIDSEVYEQLDAELQAAIMGWTGEEQD
ncbi:hypothetical protein AUC61_23810 [Pseudomonas sp. S25]|uniref:Uncharacterized protein n=1 Tax=Pseudomonas maioricensis TaxID=1766623 RepID=A0ABS9ZPS4_9PSED|nr:hypothetical protein [Pseudomonas sp. S25]MCI8212561.1 hypothetical protein [Pseudomonas sp. S25]